MRHDVMMQKYPEENSVATMQKTKAPKGNAAAQRKARKLRQKEKGAYKPRPSGTVKKFQKQKVAAKIPGVRDETPKCLRWLAGKCRNKACMFRHTPTHEGSALGFRKLWVKKGGHGNEGPQGMVGCSVHLQERNMQARSAYVQSTTEVSVLAIDEVQGQLQKKCTTVFKPMGAKVWRVSIEVGWPREVRKEQGNTRMLSFRMYESSRGKIRVEADCKQDLDEAVKVTQQVMIDARVQGKRASMQYNGAPSSSSGAMRRDRHAPPEKHAQTGVKEPNDGHAF